MSKPLLSICIPTYNRAEYLEKSLDSLIVQPEFSQIEVVISDNASTDDTEEVCKKYQEKYPNIVYYRNKENIHDCNFPMVIMRGTGIYRKLFNDTAIYENNFLSYVLSIIASYIQEKPFLFFLNDQEKIKGTPQFIICNNLNDFCSYTGRWLTWISGFGLWDDWCNNLEQDYSVCELRLWQTYKTLKIVSERNHAIILTRKILTIQYLKNKDLSYGVYTVFYKNFPSLLKAYTDNGQLSTYTFEKIRKELLYSQAGKYFFRQKRIVDKDETGEKIDIRKMIMKDYCHEPYYFHFLFWNFFYTLLYFFFDLLKKTPLGNELVNLKRKLKLY